MAIDRRFLNDIRFVVHKMLEGLANGLRENSLYIFTQEVSGKEKNALYKTTQNLKNFTFVASPVWGDVVFCEANNSFLRFEGNEEGWKVVATCEDSSQGIPTCERHILTADEVSAKSFSLSANINSGDEANIVCLVENVAQIVGTDFTASGNTISWDGKGLDDIPLVEGDTFIILYTKSKS